MRRSIPPFRLRLRVLGASLGREVWALALAVLLVGCASEDCGGGRALIDGQCVPQCDPETCGEGLYCVRSVCRPECTGAGDCLGDDTCQRVDSDNGRQGRYCYGPAVADSPYLLIEKDAGAEQTPNACKSSDDCVQEPASHCVASRCEVECLLHEHCGSLGACTGSGVNTEAQSVSYCAADESPRGAGQYGSQCLEPGTCDQDNGFQCISGGQGDTDSYCTHLGCEHDEQCPSGYYCSESLEVRPPCTTICDTQGEPSDEDCVPASEIGPGRPYRCDADSGLRLYLCLKRTFCSPCETDADCRGAANQVCARGPDGEKNCTVICSPEAGSCPWGAATTCEVFDQELGVPTCGHRYGACRGDGSSCTPCTDDRDCPRGFCTGSSFSGERFCFDETAECACEPGATACSGGGCPLTPDGLEMNCIPRQTGESPSVCFGGFTTDETARFGCWL